MRKQSLSIISAFIISTALLTGCGDTAPVPDTATPETTEASENAASETEVSDDTQEETADTATVEPSNDTDDALDTDMETATEEENKETPTEPEQPEETGYVKPAGTVDGYKNPELVPKPTDYGVSIKSMDDMPDVSLQGWDYEKHPIWYGYTEKGYKCVYDPTTDLCYYPGMMSPNGYYISDVKEGDILWDIMESKGYDNCLQITYEESHAAFGDPDMSTMSTSDWGAPNNLYEKDLVNK